MKTLKSILFGIAMLAVCTVANAKSKVSDKPALTESYVISTYIGAVTNGNLKDFDRILGDAITFNSVQGTEVKAFDKDAILANLKSNEGVKQDCTTSSSKVKETPDGTTYEIDMKYADHTRVDMVTIVEGSNGWKISDVTTSYK